MALIAFSKTGSFSEDVPRAPTKQNSRSLVGYPYLIINFSASHNALR